ncbi:hypothetical protein TYRP_010457 [Tyrophagus putrescentiae]|nr:hypothetical protein TYRP_010457 [Tyrophagus putrescentiae]
MSSKGVAGIWSASAAFSVEERLLRMVLRLSVTGAPLFRPLCLGGEGCCGGCGGRRSGGCGMRYGSLSGVISGFFGGHIDKGIDEPKELMVMRLLLFSVFSVAEA